MLAALLTVSCSEGTSPGDVAAPTAHDPVACTAAVNSTPRAGDWLTYHGGPDRHGLDANSPPVGTLRGAWGVALDGALLASPLVIGDTVIAATENDTVYALSAQTGCLAWSTHLGSPVDASRQGCYPFRTIGITATPVIDRESGLVYVLAYRQPAVHELFALDLASGRVRYQRLVDPPGSDPPSQLSRPALTLANGRVYMAFGGRPGDCGNYRGFVVGLRLGLAGEADVYAVPTARQGGIWSPAAVTVLRGGDLLVSIGNSASASTFDGGNSVVRLSPELRPLDYFAPANWAALNSKDFDLGSVGPTLLDGDRAFQVGKEGTGYLLDLNHLGGIGGHLRSASLGTCYAIGGTAYLAPFVYVPCDHGMKAVDVSGGNLRVAWTTIDIRSGSPIVAGGLIWSIDFERGYLYGFEPRDGRPRIRSRIGVAQHFVSPASARGRLFVPAGRALLAYSGV